MPGYTRQFLAPFVGGLNTELPQTQDALQYTSDELNCTLLREGMRGRRYGFNIEKDGKWFNSDFDSIIASEIFSWSNVDADKNFIVIQINNNIYIFDDTKPITDREPRVKIDLAPFTSDAGLSIEPMSFSSVSDCLFIAARWLFPLVIRYDRDSDSFKEPEIVNLKYRDFNGVDDGLEVDEETVTYNTNHIYNLLNQGWGAKVYDEYGKNGEWLVTADDIDGKRGKFYKDLGMYPSNNMQWFLGKNSSGNYNSADILKEYFGNTPAPKGHYILDYLHRSRSFASGITISNIKPSASTQTPYIECNKTFVEPIPSVGGSRANAVMFALHWATMDDASFWNTPGGEGDKHKWGIYYNQFTRVYQLPSNISGVLNKFSLFIKDVKYNGSGLYGEVLNEGIKNRDRLKSVDRYLWSMAVDVKLIGVKDLQETVLYNVTKRFEGNVCNGALALDDIVLNNDKSYDKYYIKIEIPYVAEHPDYFANCDELHLNFIAKQLNYVEEGSGEGTSYEGLPVSDLLKGAVTDIEAFGGRIFYLCGSTILFSQTLGQDNKNYEKCYQDADPTSEEISDVVATDGGMIQLLTIGNGKKLKSFYRGVIVFGDKEVDGILSGTEKLFSAVEYDMVKITNAGLIGKNTVVENDNNMFYWSSHGIYMISIDENNNISSKCISLASIQNWYNELPTYSKENCRGYFDYANNRIYWFYPTKTTNNLDGCLVYDLTYNCFMPQQVSSSNDTPNIIACAPSSSIYDITPTLYLRAGGNRVVAGENNVIIKSDEDPRYIRKSAGNVLIKSKDGIQFSLGDFNSREYYDWDNKNFDSYLVSRPIVEGDTYYNKQAPILQTLFKRTEGYKLLKSKPVEDPTNVKYVLNNMEYRTYIEQGGDEHLVTRTKVLNTGIAKKLEVVVDYTAPGVSSLTVSVRDSSNYLNIIGSKTITDVHQRNVITLDEFADTECRGYWIVCEGLTGHYSIEQECTGTFYMQRTDMSEKQFICYSAPQTVTDAKVMSKEFDLVLNEEGVDMVGGLRVSYKPITNVPTPSEFFSYDFNYTVKYGSNTYSSNSANWLNIQGASGVSTNPINISFKDLTYVDRGIPSEKIAFDTVETAELRYSYTTYKALFEEKEDYEANPVEYTTPSGAYLRMRWGWSLDKDSNRWDMVQNAYRPQKDFLHDEFVESRVHIRGRGKAYQVEVRNDDNKDFRLSGMNIITRRPN